MPRRKQPLISLQDRRFLVMGSGIIQREYIYEYVALLLNMNETARIFKDKKCYLIVPPQQLQTQSMINTQVCNIPCVCSNAILRCKSHMPISSLIYVFTAEMLSLTRIIMKIYVQHVLQIGQCVRLFVVVQSNILSCTMEVAQQRHNYVKIQCFVNQST